MRTFSSAPCRPASPEVQINPGDALELCASCGGASEGLRIIGLGNVGIEIDPVAASTAVAAGHRRVVGDISRIDPLSFAGVRGLWGSPPCTPFSSSGAGAGRLVMHVLAEGIARAARGEKVIGWVRRECSRILKAHAMTSPKLRRLPRAERSAWARQQAIVSALVVEVARYVHALTPEWVACEQVPGVLPLWKALGEALRPLGFRVWCGVLNAANYGVPQTRQRAIFLASRNPAHHVGRPEPTHTQEPGEPDLFGDPLPKWVSMAQALGWGMTARPYFTLATAGGKRGGADEQVGGTGARRALYAERDSGRWVPGGAHMHAPGRTGLAPARDPLSHVSDAITGKGTAVWVQSRPATTVQSDARVVPPGHRNREGGEHQFPEGSVRVSVAEAACLQGFRAGYPWQGTRTHQYMQVGNAVPPPLAAAVVGHMLGIDWKPLVADYLATTVLTTPAVDGVA